MCGTAARALPAGRPAPLRGCRRTVSRVPRLRSSERPQAGSVWHPDSVRAGERNPSVSPVANKPQIWNPGT
ncbi:hypothetical protein GCM10009825_03970 [Arthrobacter humicola]|uniref:Uncharacterized protein n=1 Tax=Arthrobacter humicola TaxID=409291 RepID=A0ABN2YGB6_9MICC